VGDPKFRYSFLFTRADPCSNCVLTIRLNVSLAFLAHFGGTPETRRHSHRLQQLENPMAVNEHE
jgi:hypothetical protein